MPLISVIVPVYKVEPYLHQCVDSILNQTFKDFELILVDDGSPDNCPAICDEYAKKDNRVIVIHKENGGLSSARNAGLDYVFANSNSKYISFVDSDDWVDIKFLEVLINNIESNDLVVCYYWFKNEDNRSFNAFCPLSKTVNEIDYWNYKDDGIFRVVAWNKLYKKEILKTIRYPIGKNHEDEFVIHRIIGECGGIKLLPDKLYFYRIRNDSITGKECRNDNNGLLLEIYLDRAEYYHKNNNDFLNYYGKTRDLMIGFYVEKGLFKTKLFDRLKKIYLSKRRQGYKCRKGEILFFFFPWLYKRVMIVKGKKHGNN